MDYLLHVFEAVGVGAAAGLSPLVAIATVVILAAARLGIDTNHSDVDFIAKLAVTAIASVVLAQSFLMIFASGGSQMRIAADRPRMRLLHLPLAALAGGLGGAIVFNAEGDSTVVGALVAAAAAMLVAFAGSGLLGGVVRRLDARREQAAAKGAAKRAAAKAKDDDKHAGGEAAAGVEDDARTAGRVLAVAVDIVTIAAVALALLVPPVGLVLPVLAVLLLTGGRRRDAKKHEGLRSLR